MRILTDRRRAAALFGLLLPLLLWSAAVRAVPEIQQWTTAKGAEVLFVAAPEIPMVDVRVVFAAGAARDGDQPGIGALTNALLAEGAGKLTADQIAERFDAVGANFGNDSLRDMSIFTLRSLTEPKRLKPALETFALVLGQPTFPEEAFLRERGRMLVALRYEQQSPSKIAERRFYAGLYGQHPYAVPPLGTAESLAALTVPALKAHYDRNYVAKNAVISIVGDLDRAAAEAIAEQVTAGLASGQAAAPLPKPEPRKEAERIEVAHPSTQTHVWMGQLGVQRDDPDYIPLYVGNHILGGSGLVSRISQEVREERGLAYSAYSGLSAMEARGPFIMGLQTANENRDEAMQVLRRTFAEFVAEGPTDEELERAIKNITGGYPMQIDSNSDIASYLSMIGFYDLPLDYLETFPKRIEAVTAKQIRETFQRRFHPERLLVVTVGRS